MRAFIDVNMSSSNHCEDREVNIRIKFNTGKEINIKTTCSGISMAMMGVSEIPVDVSLRNVEVNFK